MLNLNDKITLVFNNTLINTTDWHRCFQIIRKAEAFNEYIKPMFTVEDLSCTV